MLKKFDLVRSVTGKFLLEGRGLIFNREGRIKKNYRRREEGGGCDP